MTFQFENLKIKACINDQELLLTKNKQKMPKPDALGELCTNQWSTADKNLLNINLKENKKSLKNVNGLTMTLTTIWTTGLGHQTSLPLNDNISKCVEAFKINPSSQKNDTETP